MDTLSPPPVARTRGACRIDAWRYANTRPMTYAAVEAELRGPPGQLRHVPVRCPHVFLQSGHSNASVGWYQAASVPPPEAAVHYLLLEGAGSVADVFLNGRPCGRHRGAYTAGVFDLTPAVVAGGGALSLDIRVSNVDQETGGCLSQANLYYVYGGLYRPVWWIAKADLHVYPDSGSHGVSITPRAVSPDTAQLQVRTLVRNASERVRNALVCVNIRAPDGRMAATWDQPFVVAPGETVSVESAGQLESPRLWRPGSPHLYEVCVELVENGVTVDSVTEYTGIRSFEFRGGRFYLNGGEILLRGVNKHAETEHDWAAMTEEELREDWRNMTELGVNMVRLCHYPHARYEYHLADQLGLLVWAENGNACQHIDPWTPDGDRVTREMVRQLYNHPSIVCWSCGNENVEVSAAARYADAIREEDRSRPVTFASQGWAPDNCDFIAENLYSGWYEAGRNTLDYANFHDPIVAENGAGGWISNQRDYGDLATPWAVNRYEPEDHMHLFLEHRLQTLYRDRPEAHPMYLWWVFREFKNDKFKGRNSKGLVTYANYRKDAYYLWQCFARPDRPILRLVGRTWFMRRGRPDNGIKVFSNAGVVRLSINGRERAVLDNGAYRQPNGFAVNHVFHARIPLDIGRNDIVATDERGGADAMILYYMPPETGSTGGGPVVELQSSNALNPAFFVDRPILAQEPIFYDVDATGDNTWDAIPEELAGCRWIATRRTGNPEARTEISFRLAAPDGAWVYVVYTECAARAGVASAMAGLFAGRLAAVGFEPTPLCGLWRDNELQLVRFRVARRFVAGDSVVKIPGEVLDYVVLIS